ncbi:MAG TPA: cytochrome C oxidase subunit IV family protein [Flavisolibacter sp.]|jgi:cytochrome c oxidase subunit IV|nr:cytochrome C oxidase subunit IV family protein [Flavisolibacter sp.]
MEHSHISPEVTYVQHHDDKEFNKRIRSTTIKLSILTLIELGIGLLIYTMHKGEHPNALLVMMFKGMICIFTLAKAFYIVSIFMHLGDEIRNMIMTIVVPLMLFVWFIGAFLWDGNSYRTMRNRYDKHHEQKTLPQEEKAGDTTQHGLG